jgi:N6-L-threonylcarbamoyladenine synthase
VRDLLAIETSCDETAAAVIRGGQMLSNVVASQSALHERFGGVVPEIASRAHVERIVPVIDEALRRAGVALPDVGAIAVVTKPGLAGSLVIGLTAAKTLAMVLDVPLVAVDHLEAHVYACRLAAGCDVFPCVGFVISGGHTSLYECRSALQFHLLGSTTDDAAGEAFDKVAQLLALGYPGGPAVERAARGGDPKAYRFPRSFLHDERLDFSFSGLKTAVLYTLAGQDAPRESLGPVAPDVVADVAASFQQAVIDVLVGKARQALERSGLETLCVGGGVAANRALREQLSRMADEKGVRLIVPPMELCTDNAAMAAIAQERLAAGLIEDLEIDVTPGLKRL